MIITLMYPWDSNLIINILRYVWDSNLIIVITFLRSGFSPFFRRSALLWNSLARLRYTISAKVFHGVLRRSGYQRLFRRVLPYHSSGTSCAKLLFPAHRSHVHQDHLLYFSLWHALKVGELNCVFEYVLSWALVEGADPVQVDFGQVQVSVRT